MKNDSATVAARAWSPLPDSSALEAVAWAHALPELTRTAPKAAQILTARLLELVEAGKSLDKQEHPLAQQLLAGELPWTLAASMPERPEFARLVKPARSVLGAGLNELVDREGLPRARHLPLLHSLLACWTRCREVGAKLPGGGLGPRSEQRFDRLLRTALRLARPDGRPAFSRNGAAGDLDLFAAAVRLNGDADNRSIARLALGKGAAKTPKSPKLPSPAAHSEWAAAAVLRRIWQGAGQRLAVAFPEQSADIELTCGTSVLWSGPWQFDIHLDDEPAVPQSAWESTCWVSDKDVDYLELEIKLSGDIRVQRHLILVRKDGLLLLADAVLGSRRGRLRYRGTLPLVEGVEFHGADESREGLLFAPAGRGRPKPLAQVFPLALPEWREDARAGELTQTAAGLELSQAAEGVRLFAPLLFDLEPKRFRRRFTWRQLTVAHHLAIEPADVAVGYRMAIGAEQWLLYRSLAAKANRTVLGHNLVSETLLGRFAPDSGVTSLIETE